MSPSDAYVGSISMFAGCYAPKNYLDCDGSVLQIRQYEMLFAVIGPYYGGDGLYTFALPDLRPTGPNGTPQPFESGKPRYCICFNGTFPARG